MTRAALVALLVLAACDDGTIVTSADAPPADGAALDSRAANDARSPDLAQIADLSSNADSAQIADLAYNADIASAADLANLPDGGAAPIAGAGKSGYACPSGAIVIAASDSPSIATSKINGAASGATLCVDGNHQVTAALVLKANQTLVGVSGTDARLSGAVTLAPSSWHAASGGAWYYDGAAASLAGQPNVLSTFATNVTACYPVSTYQDDVFFDDQRMMRVLAQSQLPASATPPAGQAVTAGETGRFFFDYPNHRIYIDRDPTGHTVELAVLDHVLQGASGVDHVTIENLTIEKARTTGIAINSGASWQLSDDTVRFVHNVGIAFGHGRGDADRLVFTRVLVTSNGQYGWESVGSWVDIVDSELSWNNIANYRQLDTSTGQCGPYWAAGGAKFVNSVGSSPAAPGLRLLRLDAHHNIGAGFWTDVHNRYTVVAGGHFHDNEGSGYFHEISCDLDLSGAEIDHNGTPLKNTDKPDVLPAGVLVSDSNSASVHDNLIHDNPYGVVVAHVGHSNMTSSINCPPATSATDVTMAALDDTVQDNTIYQCAGYDGAAYHNFSLASRNDRFVGNRYHVPSTTQQLWSDSALEGFSAWQSTAMQDQAGSATIGCTYP